MRPQCRVSHCGIRSRSNARVFKPPALPRMPCNFFAYTGIIISLLTSGPGPLFSLGIMAGLNREAINEIIERVTAREGLELVHWQTVGPRNHFVLRIFIDKPGGVTLGDCERVSNQVGTLFDVEDLIPNQYTLEVP